MSTWSFMLILIHSTVQHPHECFAHSPFPTHRRIGELEVYRQRCKHRNSFSASNEPLAFYVPFPSLHTSSHLFLLMCDQKRLPECWGEGESSKAAADARSCSSYAGAAPENTSRGEACSPPGFCEGAVRGQMCGTQCKLSPATAQPQPMALRVQMHQDPCELPGAESMEQGANPHAKSHKETKAGEKMKFALDKGYLVLKVLR